jgi:hypothetical protein
VFERREGKFASGASEEKFWTPTVLDPGPGDMKRYINRTLVRPLAIHILLQIERETQNQH